MKFESKLEQAGHQLLKGRPLTDEQFEYFFDYYSNNGEMPYGVAKARTGDPYDWIDSKISTDYEHLSTTKFVGHMINQYA